MDLRIFLGRIMSHNPECDFLVARTDFVINDDTVRNCVFEFQRLLVSAQRNELWRVLDDCVLYPICARRFRSTIGFQIVDADFFARKMLAAND